MKAIQMRTNAARVTHDNRDGLAYLRNAGLWEIDNLKPDTNYACIMVEIPEGWRLATEEDRRGEKPKEYGYLSDHGWSFFAKPYGLKYWETDIIYLVKDTPPESDEVRLLKERVRQATEKLDGAKADLDRVLMGK